MLGSKRLVMNLELFLTKNIQIMVKEKFSRLSLLKGSSCAVKNSNRVYNNFLTYSSTSKHDKICTIYHIELPRLSSSQGSNPFYSLFIKALLFQLSYHTIFISQANLNQMSKQFLVLLLKSWSLRGPFLGPKTPFPIKHPELWHHFCFSSENLRLFP